LPKWCVFGSSVVGGIRSESYAEGNARQATSSGKAIRDTLAVDDAPRTFTAPLPRPPPPTTRTVSGRAVVVELPEAHAANVTSESRAMPRMIFLLGE
jgi:hypothetical protein